MATVQATSCAVSLQAKFGCKDAGCSERVSGLVNYLLLAECGFDGHGDAASSALSIVCVIVCGVYALIALEQVSTVHFAQTIATVVKLTRISPSIASVTLIAFGNGSSDLFSSLAAFDDGEAQLGLGILLGATFAILTGVLGAIVIMMKGVRIERSSFLRDVVFLVVTVVYLWLVVEIRGEAAIGISDTVGLFVIYALYAATFFIEACVVRVKGDLKAAGVRAVDNPLALEARRRVLTIFKPKSLELAAVRRRVRRLSSTLPSFNLTEAHLEVEDAAEGAVDAPHAEKSDPAASGGEDGKGEAGTVASAAAAAVETLRERAMHAVHLFSRLLTLPLVPLQTVSIPRAEHGAYHWLTTLLASFGMPLFMYVAFYPSTFLTMPVPRSYWSPDGEKADGFWSQFQAPMSGKMRPLRFIALCISLPCVLVQAVRIRRCGGCSAQCRGRGDDSDEEEEDVTARSCIVRTGRWLRAVPPTGVPRAILLSMSFVAAIVWIYLVANELIDAIDAVGLMLSVPPDVMGLVVVRALRALLHHAAPHVLHRSPLTAHPPPRRLTPTLFRSLAAIHCKI